MMTSGPFLTGMALLLYIGPALITGMCFRSVKRGIIVGVSAFITPVIMFLVLFAVLEQMRSSSPEAAIGYGYLALITGFPLGWVTGIALPVVRFLWKDRKK